MQGFVGKPRWFATIAIQHKAASCSAPVCGCQSQNRGSTFRPRRYATVAIGHSGAAGPEAILTGRRQQTLAWIRSMQGYVVAVQHFLISNLLFATRVILEQNFLIRTANQVPYCLITS